MKNLLSLMIMTLLILPVTTESVFADTIPSANQTVQNSHKQAKEQARKQFEERLQLSDKQKEKAKKLHEKGRQEMTPVMDELKMKYGELNAVKNSKMSEQKKTERIETLESEIKPLEKQANEIRKKNSEEFEKILNKNQKAELEKMKAEGRAKFEREHKARPPFQGLGTPGFFFRPLVPPSPNK